ncbi:MAG: hypothetical protein MJZ11_08570 [Lachnospiraceae bacterium]|nr:hypothetical protein [Lachnospiraceae bacterium]
MTLEEYRNQQKEVEERYRNGEPLIYSDLGALDWIYWDMPREHCQEFKFDWDKFKYKIITKEEIPRYKSYTSLITVKVDKDKEVSMDNVRNHNVGNSDYAKMKLQPWDVWTAWHLNPWDADIVKRIARTKEEPGMTPMEARRMDYEKIIHDAQECIRQIDTGTYWR